MYAFNSKCQCIDKFLCGKSDNLTQIIECRKLEVIYIFFEIKYRYKMDSNLVSYVGNWI